MAKHPSIDPRPIEDGRTHRRTCWKACANSRRSCRRCGSTTSSARSCSTTSASCPSTTSRARSCRSCASTPPRWRITSGRTPRSSSSAAARALKTRELLDHLEKPAAYVPVDISRDHLLEAAGALARDYPDAARDSALRRLHADRSICRATVSPRAGASSTSRARRSATSITEQAQQPARSACGRSSARTAPC